MPRVFLGLDAGSVTVSVVAVDEKREVLQTSYAFHHGRPRQTLRSLLEAYDRYRCGGVACTSSAESFLLSPDYVVDDRVAVIEASKRRIGQIGTLIIIGGEQFSRMSFDADGSYKSFKGNTSCAAGTGGFLDQQAQRLGLESAAELAALAETNTKASPSIATRCAVFAKTDLIHAQQEGYGLPAIADGLCEGMVRNILDVLLDEGDIEQPVVLAGGVALNPAISRHIAQRIETEVLVDEYAAVLGSLGAVWSSLEKDRIWSGDFPRKTEEIVRKESPLDEGRRFPALSLRYSDYPNFDCLDRWDVPVEGRKGRYPVEVELFRQVPRKGHGILGLDIGSTSTKAVVIDEDGEVILGLYTRTAGRPVEAMKGLLMALEGALNREESGFRVITAATTGSGRKLIGEILGASLILDEITAHARAAVNLDPEVDTIIEIGGQDSKFTTLRSGRVTSSVMNTVCAAGTGSFLEEQAARLGCDVTEYDRRTRGVSAPLANDRCTVFMQRDLNRLLADGFDVDEVLAAAIHSVKENYFGKVAVMSRVGKKVFFQGATARIRPLVAAFEQHLNQEILVSRYCRHTGALGAALELADQKDSTKTFRGIDLWKEEIPIRTETCDLCGNACKITLAEVPGETIAFGFLCDRDYQTEHFVKSKNRISNAEREKAAIWNQGHRNEPTFPQKIGLPRGLYLADEGPFWERFFSSLGYQVLGPKSRDALGAGSTRTGAEFCAPMTAFHGQVAELLETADVVFAPVYLEERDSRRSEIRQYCYYSQFAPTLVRNMGKEGRILAPLVKSLYREFASKGEIHRVLSELSGPSPDFRSVTDAWDEAKSWFLNRKSLTETLFEKHRNAKDINVVLLGRPYTLEDPSMHKGIPELFSRQGVRVFGMDMIRDSSLAQEPLPWKYASRIMAAAESIIRMEGTYPVFVTSFMCSPDSFVVHYARKLWEEADQPYLVLELDGHGSSVGYGTRVEAAVRAFRNHFQSEESPHYKRSEINGKPSGLKGKTLLVPNWDHDVMPLVVANLRREGIDARLLEETEDHIRRGARSNDGQCLPLNVIARETADFVGKHALNPATTILWMIRANLACNIPLYGRHIRHLLSAEGSGLEQIQIHIGDVAFANVTPLALVNTYYAYLFGGLLKRIGCRIRPYEIHAGETDRVVAMARDRLVKVFLGRGDKMTAIKDITSRFDAIAVRREERPKVAIFGDIYVRDNDVMNQDLIRTIEANGGEVVTMPYSRYAKMISQTHFRKLFREKRHTEILGWKVLLAALKRLERSYQELLSPLAGEEERYDDDPQEILSRFGVKMEHTGESMENLLKIHYIAKHYEDLALFVQTSPSFCCAGLVTEAMKKRLEETTGVPIVSIVYDGTGGKKNSVVIPYLAQFRNTSGKYVREIRGA